MSLLSPIRTNQTLNMSSVTAKPRKRASIKDLLFRSTIYNRHEARRAKTLLRKGDTRPALLRILGPPAAVTTVASASAQKITSPTQQSEASQQPDVATPFEDESIFTVYNANADKPKQRPSSVSSSVMAASVGAAFSEAVYGARCLSQASPFVASRGVAASMWQPRLVMNPGQASLMMMMPETTAMKSSVPPFPGVTKVQMAGRAAPMALLFGVKSSVEHLLSSDAAPPSAISILSSAVAGGILGSFRSLVPVAGSSAVGREVAGATLYFTVYDATKHMLVKDQDSFNPFATAAAGASAGVVYDAVRVCQITKPAQSLAAVMVRSAPSHALLFLGYEATLRLVSSTR
mmetsp:Transcript_7497/g.14651  ORF Transcript_7497/g.14651 Transcript_7497/m.14651 type:complete len:347 (-) Transcript_7497:122-1162(-)